MPTKSEKWSVCFGCCGGWGREGDTVEGYLLGHYIQVLQRTHYFSSRSPPAVLSTAESCPPGPTLGDDEIIATVAGAQAEYSQASRSTLRANYPSPRSRPD
ncbi:hypothetical protein J6590_029602 [Homalodisca vitripennis]|nr:hypothetical protein J6590_029602 [Homalodisca vitripennis]